MRVGVIGNSRYPGLVPLLRELATRAPGLGLSLAVEPELASAFSHEVPGLDSQLLTELDGQRRLPFRRDGDRFHGFDRSSLRLTFQWVSKATTRRRFRDSFPGERGVRV